MVSKVRGVRPRAFASASAASISARAWPRRRAERCTSIFASSARCGWLGGVSSGCEPCPQGTGKPGRAERPRASYNPRPDPGANDMKPIPTEIVFLAAKRTPFGTYGGSLQDLSATHLPAHAPQAALAQSQVGPHERDNLRLGH